MVAATSAVRAPTTAMIVITVGAWLKSTALRHTM